MGRMTGSWLEGPQLRRDQAPGVRLGLPADGPGSIAGFGPRLGAYVVDAIVANLLAGLPFLFGVHYAGTSRGLWVYVAFLVEEFVLICVSGQTIGMSLLRLRVIRVADGRRQTVPWILARTVLLGLLVPALVWDRDQRGLHDKTAGTAVVHDTPRASGAAAPGRRTATDPAARDTTAAKGRATGEGEAGRRGAPPARTPSAADRKRSGRKS